ncbi:tetratricopeptide repeat-containing protein [Stutzerimonas kirkiae]|uniref:Tetratricopeptide repeat protein 38 n=1 Tax=Stutzerimonas kirkiae TaxID=2211392 RepID=A0A4Q9QVX1_9GAMM|nr:tetratricopeptide repeat protein [Stutzerimonas kirkiae]TBU87985.1 tetratricopeptide repeat-containing protein [Stutzerimonas kirkiae]TBU98185.1 tetratricopeptide repeat-containing protein [Stutzerimonas kirkiae]TBV13943.1 tetratricopeptide repeat-containing protein [Stutzerimonas kirkiae]
MPADYLGNPLSTRDAATLAAIDDFIGGFITYEPRAEGILAAAEAAPRDLPANVYAGYLAMLIESPEAIPLAGHYLQRARQNLHTDTPWRERRLLDLLHAWLDDDIPTALQLADQLLQAHPRDLCSLKISQYLRFNQGDSPGMLRVALAALPHAGEIAQLHGMLAFAYEQCHLLAEAEAAARHALRLEPREPWAQHALAHVLLTQGRIEEGTAFLESVKHGWDGLNSFMYTHNWWHLALFHLARGNLQQVLDIYDKHVWGILPEYSQDQIGATSLLTRLELAGADLGPRWQALADYLQVRQQDTLQPFLSLQYLYGLARAGRPQAQTLLAALESRAASAPEHSRAVWRDVTLPAAQGLYAHTQGDFERAAQRLDQALPRLVEAGGSHAQRDLFALIAQDAHLRAGHWVTAQQLLELRRRYDADDVPSNRALARVYRELGLPGLAEQAEGRLLNR